MYLPSNDKAAVLVDCDVVVIDFCNCTIFYLSVIMLSDQGSLMHPLILVVMRSIVFLMVACHQMVIRLN